MFTPQVKARIAEQVQKILRETNDSELPKGEIQFILHVDGSKDTWAFANIRNNNAESYKLPEDFINLLDWIGL